VVLNGRALGTVGTATRLPFRARSFDVAAASLVLSHVDRYDQALLEAVRVLKPGGRVGITAWTRSTAAPSPASDAWTALAQAFVGRAALDEALRRVVPHEGRLSEAAQLSAALAAAALQEVQIEQRQYRIRMRTSDYLEMSDIFTYGRFLRATLGASRWREFRSQAADRLQALCGDAVEYTAHYHLALARKG
jgi:SAM-dependent methyltransferase